MSRSLSFVFVAALVAGCGGGAADVALESAAAMTGTASGKKPPPPPPPAAAPEVVPGTTGADPGDAAYVAVSDFALEGTPEIWIVADWKNVASTDHERLDVLTPSGTLYVSNVVPLSGTTRSDVRVTTLADGRTRVAFVLPVAGTPIDSYQLVGTWSVQVALEGGTAAAATAFALH